MTDLEMTKLCAEAMGYEALREEAGGIHPRTVWYCYSEEKRMFSYDPLHDDAHAMALVKRFRLDIITYFASKTNESDWLVRGTVSGWEQTKGRDLNRAIVECVSKMQVSLVETA